jgi:bacteriorhodopsin
MSLHKFIKGNNSIVAYSVYLSLLVQFIIILVSFTGIQIELYEKDYILNDILVLETIVQVVEFIFYISVVISLSNLREMATRRYYDWFITTPLMLFSTIVFMEYQKNRDKILTIKNFIKENTYEIIVLFFTNLFMLIFGLLNERKILSKTIGIFIGTLFFLYGFYIIYDRYAKFTNIGTNLFIFLFIVWGLYGVAACLNDKYKNTMFNLLDIVSKNFYAIYIYYFIYTKRII